MLDKKKEIAIEEKKKWISLTGLCNNSCIFCLDGDRNDRYHRAKTEVEKDIEKGFKEGATRLVLSGGDPTIHPDITSFVRYGKKIGYKRTQIITNGRMLAYKSFVNSLADAGLDEVTFSTHGHNAGLHDTLTSVKGSFKQVMRGVKNAQKAGFIVNSDTVVNKLNYKYLPEIISFLYSKGINEVNLMSIVPFGRAWKNREIILYEFEDIMPFVNKVIEYCKENNITLWFSRFPAEYLENYPEYIESPKKILEEVLARGEDFFRKRPLCYGERCKYCGVKSVCSNLVNKEYDNAEPICLADNKAGIKNIIKLEKPFKEAAEKICMNMRAKRLSCSKCIYAGSCSGILVEKARKEGFSSLKPITNNKAGM